MAASTIGLTGAGALAAGFGVGKGPATLGSTRGDGASILGGAAEETADMPGETAGAIGLGGSGDVETAGVGAGRDGTGLGISRSCQLGIGSGLKVEAAGALPKSNDAAGLVSTGRGATGGGAALTVGAGEATTDGAGELLMEGVGAFPAGATDTGRSMPGMRNTPGVTGAVWAGADCAGDGVGVTAGAG